MMIHAYQETSLSSVQKNMGLCFDYAINTLEIPGKDFVEMFVVSSISKQIQTGNPAYILGKSGIELALEIVTEAYGKEIDYVEQDINYHRSKEYWIGWVIAFYQWYSDYSFAYIFDCLSFDELELMYPTLHEADITKFIEIANKKMKKRNHETRLKYFRSLSSLTQADLAELSGVSLRAIQMYEQKHKDINKAKAETIYQLSKVLGVSMENLLEKSNYL